MSAPGLFATSARQNERRRGSVAAALASSAVRRIASFVSSPRHSSIRVVAEDVDRADDGAFAPRVSNRRPFDALSTRTKSARAARSRWVAARRGRREAQG